MQVLQSTTSPEWLALALSQFDDVLIDHAHCEKKAAAAAMALVAQYPDRAQLVRRCVKLAQEELRHFYQVHRIIVQRGLVYTRDEGDPYAQLLLKQCRNGPQERLIDRLLVMSLIEARSCERLSLLAEGLQDESLAKFYRGLATAEAGHHRLFVDLAELYENAETVQQRLQELAQIEARIVADLPLTARVH